ncbi:hypothetical protein [Streptomyces sp. MAI_2237]
MLVGLFGVSVLHAGDLSIAKGGSLVPVLFSLGRLLTTGLLAVAAVALLAWQHLVAATPLPARTAPLPGWSKPALAVLGSSWLGIGAGLLTRPGLWSGFVPWSTNRLDAQALGVWALALGVGVLGALAEDDLDRTRPALLAPGDRGRPDARTGLPGHGRRLVLRSRGSARPQGRRAAVHRRERAGAARPLLRPHPWNVMYPLPSPSLPLLVYACESAPLPEGLYT